MRRREFILGIGAAAGLPRAVPAQEPTAVIGFLNTLSLDAFAHRLEIFRQGLKEAGYAEGQNVRIEYRWAGGDYQRLPALADELARLRVAVIVTTGGSASVRAAKEATSTVPIVFTAGGDPVKLGLVTSLNHPGGNITGVNVLASELVGKRLELLQELAPKAPIAMLTNPNSAIAEADAAAAREAARHFGLAFRVVQAGAQSDFASTFANLARTGAGALLVDGDPLFEMHADALVALAAKYSLPAIYSEPEYAAAGGLASYGPSIPEAYHQAGIYAGRILRGEKPTDLPVVQLSKVALIINLKTAKALGLTVPQSILARADEVIE